MPGGRPTKYNQEIIDASNHYLENFKENGDVIPSIEGLSEHLDVSRTCLYEWQKHEDKEEFSYILAKILVKQARILINSGLKGDFNAAIAKLALGKHGYSDKQDLTSSDGSMSPKSFNDFYSK
jgi:hypothetical protein